MKIKRTSSLIVTLKEYDHNRISIPSNFDIVYDNPQLSRIESFRAALLVSYANMKLDRAKKPLEVGSYKFKMTTLFAVFPIEFRYPKKLV